MVSAAELKKRLGVGGRLVPFFKSVCVYFALGGWAAPSAGAAAAKCAPVLCLLLCVLLQHGAALHARARYARRIALGLALSALGDALLLWPQHFVAGMAAFAGAHVAYLAAFGWRPGAWRVAGACYAAAAGYLALLAPPPALRALVPLYGALLATMAWRGVARGAARGGWARRAGAAGALLFLLSDALLGYSLFGGAEGRTLPHKQVLVMSTYYVGQLGIALSALEPSEPARAADCPPH